MGLYQFKIIIISIIILLLQSSLSYAKQPTIREYQIKAVFLYNFTYFVRWPPSVFESSISPFRICVLGTDPFRGLLKLAVKNETVDAHNVQIQVHSTVKNTNSCHILFISRSEVKNLRKIFKYLKQRAILTVSGIENFARDGGMIQFVNMGKNIRFYMNRRVAIKANVRISANLLYIARKVFQ
ncbi:YfiR family protein [Candidatus Marithrix sp. Canyon 246]|uniref:YfiR family protein n=1 Tax=Candidatus Marithrix sp. Canyon 246 TaxID=1827136 RepID=UPI00084A0EFE|nr:YfiR family protein [Candidatus Marithrix sp. Canyon 246]